MPWNNLATLTNLIMSVADGIFPRELVLSRHSLFVKTGSQHVAWLALEPTI